MRKKYIFGKKLYISILTSIVVLMTTIATTFAWVGVFANGTFDAFDFSVKASSLKEYGVEISATGEEGTFSDTIDGYSIKKQILANWGYKPSTLEDEDYVSYTFSRLNMHQCTNLPILDGTNIKKLGQFKTIENMATKNYFKFDIYVSSIQFYESSTISTYLLDLYLGDGLLTGGYKTYEPSTPVKYDESFVNPLINLSPNLTKINGGDSISFVTSSSASACRVAFEKYRVVNKYAPNEYTSNEEPISTVIYSTDKYNYPTYNETSQYYEFGGILPDESNFAILNYNQADYRYSQNGIKKVHMDQDIYNIRGVTGSNPDLILSSNTNQLVNSANENEQINLHQMMKITCYFWIEGWDSDCINTLNQNPITLNITLNTVPEDVF